MRLLNRVWNLGLQWSLLRPAKGISTGWPYDGSTFERHAKQNLKGNGKEMACRCFLKNDSFYLLWPAVSSQDWLCAGPCFLSWEIHHATFERTVAFMDLRPASFQCTAGYNLRPVDLSSHIVVYRSRDSRPWKERPAVTLMNDQQTTRRSNFQRKDLSSCWHSLHVMSQPIVKTQS
jgi:hypothetical protein